TNYAAKVMHGKHELRQYMHNELDIMNGLNHRNLIRLYDAYQTDRSMALITELAGGGELVRDNLLRKERYGESEIAGYIRQLLLGLRHMHDSNIAHLSLTIGDLLVAHAGGRDLKICDFGLARRVNRSNLFPLDFGMPEYVSPETALGQGVGLASDMWSVGIITWLLLGGKSPFLGMHDVETLDRVKDGKWSFANDEEWWSHISSEGKDFISKL
ncbi:obscurin-like, partial [Ctenocephalides felis]